MWFAGFWKYRGEGQRKETREKKSKTKKNRRLTVRDDEKVGLPAQVDVPDPGEQEARDGVLLLVLELSFFFFWGGGRVRDEARKKDEVEF